MPDETHRYLIQYETTATRAAAEMQQVTRTLQDQVQWTHTATATFQQQDDAVTTTAQAYRQLADAAVALTRAQERLATVGRMDISGLPVSGRIQQRVEQLRELATAQEEVIRMAQAPSVPGFEQVEPETTGVTAREKLAARLLALEANAKFAAEAFRRFDEAIAANIPSQMAVSQAIRETAASFRTLQEATEAPLTGSERLAARLEAIGADVEFTTEAFRRYDEAVAAHIPTEMAVSQAIRETATTFRTLQKEIDPTLSGLDRLQARLQEIGASTRVTTAQQPTGPTPLLPTTVLPSAGAGPTTEELRRFVEESKTSMQGLGEATDFTSRAVARYNELIAANIPEQHAINQAISETVKAFRAEESAARRAADALAKRRQAFTRARQITGGPGGETEISPAELFRHREQVRVTRRAEALGLEGTMVEKMEARGIFQENQIKIAERYKEVLSESLSPQDAFARAQREIAKELQTTGETAQKSGHWLANYIQRYLVRYFVVWQGMVALKAGIRDWIQAHDDMARAMFRVQGAMQATTSEARQYMGTLAGIGAGIGVPAGQMVEGAIQTGQPQLVGQMAQWGQVTGAGAQQAIALFTRTQRDYNLTAEETEMIMARLFVAWDKLGIPIQEITGDMSRWLGKIGEAPGLIDYMNQRLEEFGEQGLNASDKLATGWGQFLSRLGNLKPWRDLQATMGEVFSEAAAGLAWLEVSRVEKEAMFRQYEAETGVSGRTPIGTTAAFTEWRQQLTSEQIAGIQATAQAAAGTIQGAYTAPFQRQQQAPAGAAVAVGAYTAPSVAPPATQAGGMGTQLIDSVQIMTQAQYEQLDKITQQHEDKMEADGIHSKLITEHIAVDTEQGYIFQSIDTNILALLLANEDMRNMQRQQLTGVWNFPSGAVMITTPQALGQVELQGPTPPPYTSAVGGELYIPGASPYGVDYGDIYGYQHGGPVTETGPAIVHEGEYVVPQDQARRLSLPESLPMLERLIGRQPMATEPRRGRLDDEPLVEPRRIEQDWPTQFVPMQPADNLQETIMGLMQTFNVPQYQYGGVVPGPVGQPQPAIVEGGESITPRGQAAMGSIKLHSHLYLNSREIASDVAKIQGDKLLQAQRASVGATGSLISI